MFDLVVIGGGAAGFYGAIRAAEANNTLSILILEKTTKLLSKVRVSGGGRCNVTHDCFEPKPLASHYPRGEKPLRELFRQHQAKDVVNWFAGHGVKLKAEEDGRMFPVTDDSQTIIDCFLRQVQRHTIQIKLSKSVTTIRRDHHSLKVVCEDGSLFETKNVLVTIGGHANAGAYEWLKELGHTVDKPIPSLFTFNDSKKEFTSLMGVSVPNALVKIEGTKFLQNGPVLITHWGLSGPAIIKLSAWAAEYLHQHQYVFSVLVSWVGGIKEEELRQKLQDYKEKHPKLQIRNHTLFELPARLWEKLCEQAEIEEGKIWGELPLKNSNKLLENLLRCRFNIRGKTTFKEEFVTCGGVSLHDVNLQTMESKKIPHLYFAGEVLNIDGETGGFNFQAAWTTAYIAALSISGLKNEPIF